MKPWQHGIELAELQRLKAPFDQHDEGLILGAFTRVKENRIAEWIHRGQLHSRRSPDGDAVVAARLTGRQAVKDFTRLPRLRVPEGAVMVERFAGPVAVLSPLLRQVLGDGPAVVHGWVEHRHDRLLLESLGLRLAAVKIRASSELVGVWERGCQRLDPLPPPDFWGLREAPGIRFDPEPVAREIEAAGLGWADHYSGYNKRHSWAAVCLRSFGGDPEFIEKPSEMSKQWKIENPYRLGSRPQWTPLASRLPRTMDLVEAIPADFERVRLMRLTAGGGELTRHADITDLDAGTQPGKLLRLHLPIVTNHAVRFRSWLLDGTIQEEHMGLGELWSLDTRKPHTAINQGQTDRVHLVIDAWSSPQLLRLLGA